MVLGVSVRFGLLLAFGLPVCIGQDVDPCDNYQTLSEEWRDPAASGGASSSHTNCDIMAEGWYAFVLGMDQARIPTVCMQDNTCGAKVPLHVDMGDRELPEVGENVTAWLCGSFNVLGSLDCCVQRQPVIIKQCADPPGTFIYYLKPQNVCPVAICAARVKDTIPEHYRGKPGDRPRSLQGPAASPTTDELPTSPEGTAGLTTLQEIVRSLRTIDIRATSPPTVPPLDVDNSTTSDSSSSSSFLDTSMSSIDNLSDSSLNLTTDSTAAGNFSSAGNSTESSSVKEDTTVDFFYGHGNSTENVSSSDLTVSVSDTGMTNLTTSTDEYSGPLSDNTTTLNQNTADSTSVYPVDVASPDLQQSSDSMDSVTRAVTTSLKPFSAQTLMPGSQPSTPAVVSVSMPDSSQVSVSESVPEPDRNVTSGLPSTMSPVPVTPEQSREAVRFVLNGTFEESVFRNSLLLFVNNISQSLTMSDEDEGLHQLTIKAESSLDNLTVVDVYIINPATNDTIPADRLVTIIQNDNFADQLFAQADLAILAVCPSTDHCDDQDFSSTDENGRGGRHESLFEQNQAIFIAVIVVAAFCLLALLLGLLFVRCRRQGTWVLAPDHEVKGPEPMAVESPITDNQILQGESETTLTVNGDRYPHHTTDGSHADVDNNDDIPAADEDNGWVVPLDQAPQPASEGLADKTEDTQF